MNVTTQKFWERALRRAAKLNPGIVNGLWEDNCPIKFPKHFPYEARKPVYELIRGKDNESKLYHVAEKLISKSHLIPYWATIIKKTDNYFIVANLINRVTALLELWDYLQEKDLLLTRAEVAKKCEIVNKAIDDLIAQLDKNKSLFIEGIERDRWHELEKLKESLQDTTLDIYYGCESLPRKMNAVNAKQTFIIVALKRFLIQECGQPLSECIAEIVCVLLDVKEISKDTVNKAG